MEALQRYLRKFGYYAPERKVDGSDTLDDYYGDFTRHAVEDLQGTAGDLKADGVARPLDARSHRGQEALRQRGGRHGQDVRQAVDEGVCGCECRATWTVRR